MREPHHQPGDRPLGSEAGACRIGGIDFVTLPGPGDDPVRQHASFGKEVRGARPVLPAAAADIMPAEVLALDLAASQIQSQFVELADVPLAMQVFSRYASGKISQRLIQLEQHRLVNLSRLPGISDLGLAHGGI